LDALIDGEPEQIGYDTVAQYTYRRQRSVMLGHQIKVAALRGSTLEGFGFCGGLQKAGAGAGLRAQPNHATKTKAPPVARRRLRNFLVRFC
jgi:hypothetical protein